MFEDIGARTRAVVRWFAALVATLCVCIAANVYAMMNPSVLGYYDAEMGPIDWVALATFSLCVATGVATLRWIRVANANAQRLAGGMRITAGWNVGWFFVPVANLWKPFQGLRETWAVSHDAVGWQQVRVPALLRWWWAAWLAVTLFSGIAQVAMAGDLPDPWYETIPIAVSILSIGATLLLWRVLIRLARAQAQAIVRHTFA